MSRGHVELSRNLLISFIFSALGGVLGGCGPAETDADVVDAGGDELRPSRWCVVAPNPTQVASSYSVSGAGLPKNRLVRVEIADAGAHSVVTVTVDATGAFRLSGRSDVAGPGSVTVSTAGTTRPTQLATCAFTVVEPTWCGDGSCDADESSASCPADCPVSAPRPGVLALERATAAVDESAGAVELTVVREDGSDGEVSVAWRTRTFDGYGTADWASDYLTVYPSATLTFAAGETRKSLRVVITPDELVEGPETFSVMLLPTLGGGATLGALVTTVVTIVDDDVNVPPPPPPPTPSPLYGYDPTLGAEDDPRAAPHGGVARYVAATGGSNSGSGDLAHPWADLGYALTHCAAGDTLYLRGGVHHYRVSVNGGVAATAAMPVEVRSYPGEWAILDGAGIVASPGFITIQNVANLVLRNFEIRNSYAESTTVSGLYLIGVSDSELHNLYSHHNSGSGFKGLNITRVAFFNCTASDNFDAATGGQNADGFAFNTGTANALHRCVGLHNSDDGFDAWGATETYFEDCVAANNGFGTTGNGNGFKLGGSGTSPSGDHTLVRAIAVGNKTRGFDENGSKLGSTFVNCVAANTGWANWRLPYATTRHTVTNCLTLGTGTAGDSFAAADVVTSLGGQLGGSVLASHFESVLAASLNSTVVGERFFYPRVTATQLIDRGTDVGQAFRGAAPDLGAIEYQP